MQNSTTIGFIGAGNMAYAIMSGLINNGTSAKQIKLSDTNEALLSLRKDEFNLEVFTDNVKLVTHCDVIVLAVKPQVLSTVCHQLENTLKTGTLIISIAAGVRARDIDRWLGGNQSIVRTMPNTPALLNQGVTGLFANESVTDLQKQLAGDILDSVGQSLWVEEELMLDAVTALSGSGPAYFFLMIESMANAGVALGLDEQTAQKLSIQTALGASMMASTSGDSAHELRAKVTSPNGTTQAAIDSFQDQNFDVMVAHAMRAAFDRAGELGVELGNSD
ncbi:Pyrroline-5-carboxylate reductase (EC 1.5.1.2) [uncultured Gammaproteobacteria bacterium]|uniref:pyrroline-5-carboxylate reductase n=1 Tax=Bathymodiolus heckerae thiotrophic gill symbiont TaxID=1052212 RepID=UPI0010B86F9A|nr:pyrroline-5-carboxylate reductase [Bathymodiolus heckerae thiotrophic gill symbiont]CAC9953489.1 Pyrroline-5-carboxylate reductase (EC 1.5.1.2) [uncultured Gammaproteobacteria bacterium]SHN91278.1 Pyrroline-5-carboxylate reductase [Bathymodiolus heckerae thiotrophic gill symbiont]